MTSPEDQAFRMDVLKELGNIGSGRAATALSQLLNRRIEMKVPQVHVMTFSELLDSRGGADVPMNTVVIDVHGDVEGRMFFMLDLRSVERIVEVVLGERNGIEQLSEMAYSFLFEMGNILVSSYFSSLSDLTGLKMSVSVPRLSIDMLGAILGEGLAEMEQLENKVIVIDAEILEGQDRIEGAFCFIPLPSSMDALFRALGV
jgi:chemotaxis protein CheC